jgi:DNA-binding CsgD family transcriptional regulator/tetratricopeptide (TPR) repeat protein
MSTLPGPLSLSSGFPFVGRASELVTLRSLVPWAGSEGRRIALVGGEAGSGKSRLVREFAADTAGGGALVLYGACDAMVRPPYGPFVEALRDLGVDRLLPDGSAADPDTERHRLHTTVADLLERASRDHPVLLVLEDAHWADAPTLGLLRHLARAAGRARLLVVATFRDTESDMQEALSETLADLRRSDDIVRLRLGGLSPDEIAEFVRRAAGDEEAAPELAHRIAELTGGNPFLVCELWRSLGESDAVRLRRPLDDFATPESVREVVARRLARLRPATADLLELAATAGAEFDLDVLRPVDESELRPALEEAVSSGMIEELPSRGLAFRFTHELVRRSLYDGLSAVRRAELHLRVGQALERSGARSVADLAHHFAAAAPFGGAERGVEYNVRAARAASDGLDFDAAADGLRVALELGVERPAERAGLLLELGAARNRAGRAVDALTAYAEAADIATELGDADLLARAAIGYEEACWRPVITDPLAVDLLERAAVALGDEDSELRVGVLGGLARALEIRGRHSRGAAVRDDAVAMARRLGDRRALAGVLVGSYWDSGTRSPEKVLAMLTEARDLAYALGDVDLRAEAMSWRSCAFLSLFALESARREVVAVLEMAAITAQPFHHHVADHNGSAIALCEGRLSEADALAERSHEWSRLLTGRDASGVYGIQMFSVRREQGRLAELAPVVRVLAADPSRGGAWRPGLASLLVELGMEAESRRELGRVAAAGLDEFRTSLWLASLTYLTDAATALGDEAMAGLLYPELVPYEGANAMIGHVVACYGAADRHLGMLAATLGEWERAESHFERAMRLNRRMGARTWLAHTAYEYGRMLLGRGRRGERDRAAELLAEADRLAGEIGMPALLARVRALGAPRAVPGPPDGLSFREVQILGLVAKGLSNREIGSALFISEHTAANHIRSILRKTNCANRTEAASYAHRHGLVEA